MSWKKVGGWIKDNAGTGASLVGSLLTGNTPGAVAAGVALVSSATGTDSPEKALQSLQGDPQAMIKLKELYYQNEDSIRLHIERMARIELESFESGQKTVRSGDNAEDPFVKRTRPGQTWVSLFAAIGYIFGMSLTDRSVDFVVVGALLGIVAHYHGMRQWGKNVEVKAGVLKN